MPDDEYVCWSRMQTEAGQPLARIVARKEAERRAGGGVFAWGVGNAPARSARDLARLGVPVRVVFSVMKGRPRPVDVSPGRVVAWRRFVDSDGVVRPLPANVVVTSRADSATGAKRHHAALLCRSEAPLVLEPDAPSFDPDAFVNAGPGGAPVGASQVTALLRRVGPSGAQEGYRADMVADLVSGYWVRLVDPVELGASRLAMLASAGGERAEEWLGLAEWLKADERPRRTAAGREHTLL